MTPSLKATALAFVAIGASLALAQPPAHFSMIIEQTGDSISARCETGCHWTQASAKFGGRPVLVTTEGIAGRQSSDSAGFAFRISATPHGWRATSIRGTTWSEIGYGCDGGTCRSRLTEGGVRTF